MNIEEIKFQIADCKESIQSSKSEILGQVMLRTRFTKGLLELENENLHHGAISTTRGVLRDLKSSIEAHREELILLESYMILLKKMEREARE